MLLQVPSYERRTTAMRQIGDGLSTSSGTSLAHMYSGEMLRVYLRSSVDLNIPAEQP